MRCFSDRFTRPPYLIPLLLHTGNQSQSSILSPSPSSSEQPGCYNHSTTTSSTHTHTSNTQSLLIIVFKLSYSYIWFPAQLSALVLRALGSELLAGENGLWEEKVQILLRFYFECPAFFLLYHMANLMKCQNTGKIPCKSSLANTNHASYLFFVWK